MLTNNGVLTGVSDKKITTFIIAGSVHFVLFGDFAALHTRELIN